MRRLPAVDRLLQAARLQQCVAEYGREATLDALRGAVQALRAEIVTGWPRAIRRATRARSCALRDCATIRQAASLKPAINATGVILHTIWGARRSARMC